jgi:predicted amidohydrolase YtcJ
VIPRERLVALVSAAHAAGFPVALHSVGDGAVRLSLDAFEAAELAHPGPRPAHRIEHIEVLSPEDTPRFARLGVIASMQPFHAYPEPPTEVWSTNLGPGRLPRTFAWRDLLDAKATLIFGSDWPVASPNPLWGLAVATTRKDKDGQPPGGWNAREAITPAEALFAYTVAPQRAAGRDAVGTLDVGQVADLAVLSKGVSLDDAPSLWAGHVAVTIMDGVVRTAGASAPR